jgi:aerobic-type carbon monoxide dehydrogenase small subunit (CoxS/CutS family)
MISLTVNGQDHTVDVAPDTPLLWVLREHLGMTGTKYGCGIGECGACNVHMNGELSKSCQVSAGKASGANIVTIEGLGGDGLHPVQEAFIKENTTQCGFCMPGQVMSAAAMLAVNPEPTDGEIDVAMKDNLCRCGAHARIRSAIHRAASSAA